MEDLIIKFMKPFKRYIKLILPRWAWMSCSRRLIQRRKKRDAHRPVKDVFTDIYKQNLWGDIPKQYSSGSGSTDPSVSVYAEAIKRFISTKQITKVVDLGCGDFKVGSQIHFPGTKYIGVDIVQELVDYNDELFGNDNISFFCMDIIRDNLPNAELCLIRQVLQHLSNQEISQILRNIIKYKYVIVTEHYPPSYLHIIPNKEKPHGLGIRIENDSAVYLDQLPFNVKISEVLLDMEISEYTRYKGERLITFLIQHE